MQFGKTTVVNREHLKSQFEITEDSPRKKMSPKEIRELSKRLHSGSKREYNNGS